MESNQHPFEGHSLTIDQLYNEAEHLFIHEDKNGEEIAEHLIDKYHISQDDLIFIMNSLSELVKTQKAQNAKKDILYGALWCIGGTVFTMMDVGYIFWGAILFGGIQLLKGMYNLATG